MARFMANIKGAKSEASRLGTGVSGVWGHVRGWSAGVEVDGRVVDGSDSFMVSVTGGSNGTSARVVAMIEERNTVRYVTVYNPSTGDKIGTWAV